MHYWVISQKIAKISFQVQDMGWSSKIKSWPTKYPIWGYAWFYCSCNRKLFMPGCPNTLEVDQSLYVNLTNFFVKPSRKAAKLMIFHQHNYKSDLISYLVNSIAIQLRDRRLGGIWFLQTLGSHFIPRGFAPWDEISPSGLAISMHPSQCSCNTIFRQINFFRNLFSKTIAFTKFLPKIRISPLCAV